MPTITFLWYPRADAFRVAPLVDQLQSVAEDNHVSFYVNANEQEENERVIIEDGVTVPSDVAERLRTLAKATDVTIYVHPAG